MTLNPEHSDTQNVTCLLLDLNPCRRHVRRRSLEKDRKIRLSLRKSGCIQQMVQKSDSITRVHLKNQLQLNPDV